MWKKLQTEKDASKGIPLLYPDSLYIRASLWQHLLIRKMWERES